VGPFALSLNEIGELLYIVSLGMIIVLRSTRMSRQQAMIAGELAAAQQVQQVLLPEKAETIPGFVVESVYEPAQQVGGDFFQILPTRDGGMLLVVGDVAGKGLPAAMLVSVLVGAIRTAASYSFAPDEMLTQLNERLIGRTNGAFSTALAAHIAADGRVTIANAGHLSPYLDGDEVELQPALPLGILSGAHYEKSYLQLTPGNRLTFYSDGVIEAQNPKGELLGFDRARELSTQPASAIVETAVRFGQSDDITVVAIQWLGAAAMATPALSEGYPQSLPAPSGFRI
jgi:serine phosphatase RsbU (regulator of sigma subunit)